MRRAGALDAPAPLFSARAGPSRAIPAPRGEAPVIRNGDGLGPAPIHWQTRSNLEE